MQSHKFAVLNLKKIQKNKKRCADKAISVSHTTLPVAQQDLSDSMVKNKDSKLEMELKMKFKLKLKVIFKPILIYV